MTTPVKTNEMNDKIFIFDMDGVIVDTVSESYAVYFSFLKSFGAEGDLEECKMLDGLKTEEIIHHAIRKHNLPGTEKDLLEKYLEKTKRVYDSTKLSNGVEEILKLLRKNNFKIALASSSKRVNIESVLNRFNLRKYFDFIVSGDDVSEAKPSPEIYNLVKSRFKNHQYYVLEDSNHGITSAKRAKMEVIFFNPHQKDIYNNVDYSISKMTEMENLLKEIETNCKTITLLDNVVLRLRENVGVIPPAEEEIVNQNWNQQSKSNPLLFNGTIICYGSHSLEKGVLTIDCFPVEYKCFLAQLDGKVNFDLKQLAVSGLILDEEGNTLISQRSNTVTAYKRYYEFVPSGGIEGDFKNLLPVEDQLAQEFREETGIELDKIAEIRPFSLVFDQKNKVYDICCLIKVKSDIHSLITGGNIDEYLHHNIVKVNEVDDFLRLHDIVPTSLTMINVFKKWNNY